MMIAMLIIQRKVGAWTRRRCSEEIDRWAASNGFVIIDKKTKWNYYPHTGPFSFMWAGNVYRVTLTDAEQRTRVAWLRMDISSKVAQVYWDDDRRWGDREDRGQAIK
jgi:hypothetical protein